MLTRRRWTLLLAVALLAAACNGGPDVGPGDRQPPRGVKRGTLQIINHGDVDALDPGYGYAAVDWALLRGVVRELYSFDSRLRGEQAMKPVPDLADGPYQLSADGRTYTFRLRKGVRYAPPVSREVRAEDFVYAVERQLDPDHLRSPNPYSSLIEGTAEFASGKAETISGMRALDDYTLKITLEQPASDFLSILTLPFFSPVPREHAAEFEPGEEYAKNLVGSGPYTVNSYDPGRLIELERNQNWDPRTDPLRKAWVDKITVTIRRSEAGIQQAIERGEKDLNLDNTPPLNAELQRLSGDREASLARADIRLKPKFFQSLQVYKRTLRLQSKKDEHQLGAARWCPDWPGNGSRSFIGVLLDGRKITPTANNNYGNYDNPKVNTMIDRAYATAEEPARNTIWGQVDRLLMDDAAWAPLVYDREAFFWSARVRNWTFTPWLANPDITNLWLDPNTP